MERRTTTYTPRTTVVKKSPFVPDRKRLKTGTSEPLPEKLQAVIPESKIYNTLVEFERRLDSTLNRRKSEIYEALRLKPQKTTATLRIWISNTSSNQGGEYHIDSSFASSLTEPSSWTLKIRGKILEETIMNPGSKTLMKVPKRMFSSFFNKIFVQLDKNLFPDEDIVEWHRTPQTKETEGFEIKRIGNQETTAKILLYLDHKPPVYKISPELAKLIMPDNRARYEDTRARIVMAIWQYIKVNKLQDLEDRKTVILNPQLKAIFGVDKMQFSHIPQLVGEHLGPPDPYEIDFTIRLTSDGKVNERVFDLPIQVEDMTNVSPTIDASMKEIELLNDQILQTIGTMNKHKRKREFMLGFSTSPVDFINDLIASQVRDWKVMNSETGKDDEDERHSTYYYQPLVEEAVQHVVHSQPVPQEQ